MPTVTEVSLLPPLLMQAGESHWGTLPRRCHLRVSQSVQKSPNPLGSSKAKPAPGARAASASAKAPGEGAMLLLPGWSSVLGVSPCPAPCQGGDSGSWADLGWSARCPLAAWMSISPSANPHPLHK